MYVTLTYEQHQQKIRNSNNNNITWKKPLFSLVIKSLKAKIFLKVNLKISQTRFPSQIFFK